MGTWKIVIKGHGIHHNNNPDDANEMAKELVSDMRAAGHHIEEATIQLVDHNYDELPNLPAESLEDEISIQKGS